MTPDPVQAAIDRGDATARLLISHRDSIIYHLAAVFLITGPEGLRACAAGAAEAVIIAHGLMLTDADGEVVAFPDRAGEGA
jgi:hypothetical protein